MAQGDATRGGRLLAKLLAAYLVPILALLSLFGLLARRVTRQSLEDSLGRRLTGIAQAVAAQVRASAISFLEVGDEKTRTYRNVVRKLELVQKRTGVERLMIFDRELKSRTDTHKSVRIGDHYYQAEADRVELARVFAGKEASSVLFKGKDGRLYKTGYAPLTDRDGKVIAAVAVVGSARFLGAVDQLATYLWLNGGVVAALGILISVLLARRISMPLAKLARAAERIGAGDLQQPITIDSRDEIGVLASTMNQMRADLHEREQQLQMMLSGIAHEVRNPLGGIALFAGLLREELEGDDEKLEMVHRIERELGYLKNVVGEFLDYARRSPPNIDAVELDALLADVADVVAGDAEAAGVELVRDLGTAVSVEADREQLRRVLLNLARNALQATPQGGTVTLRCATSDDERAFFEVADTGSGIADEVVERIYEPFFTTREKGTGLGLALSKKILDEHGAELSVETSSAGTRFRSSFPSKPRRR